MKTIIFDWGGVCCTAAEPFASTRLQQTLGKNPDEIAAAVKDEYAGYYLGRYTREQFWDGIIAHFGLKGFAADELSDAYRASYKLHKDVIALIKHLRKEHRVVLLSNLTPEMKDHIKKIDHADELFERLFFSCDMGMMKPDAATYQKVLQELKAAPQDCIFIDDSQKNVEAARSLGIDAIHFTDGSALLMGLIARGIRPVFLPNNHSESVINYVPAAPEEQAAVNDVLQGHYGLTADGLERIDLPARNSVNYRCIAGARDYFVRNYRGKSTRDALQRTHQVLAHCAARGVSVPSLIVSLKGSTLITHAGQLYALFPFIHGMNYQGSHAELASAGTAIARMHRALASLPLELVQHIQISTPATYAATAFSFEELDKIKTAAEAGASSFDRAATRILPELRKAIEDVLAHRAKQASLSLQVIHSDLHPHNLLTENGQVRALLDFDAVRWGERARDVAFALHRLVRQYIVHTGDADLSKAAQDFLTAYAHENPLTPEERAALVPLMREEIVQKLVFVLRNHYIAKDGMWDAELPKFMMLFDEVAAFGQALGPA